MKRKVGKLYGKFIVEGDKNITTSNEIHIDNLDIEGGGGKLPFKVNKYLQVTPKDNSLAEDTNMYDVYVSFLVTISTMITYEGYLASNDVRSKLNYCPKDFTSYSFFLSFPYMYFEDDGDGHYIPSLVESLDLDEGALSKFLLEKFDIKYIDLK